MPWPLIALVIVMLIATVLMSVLTPKPSIEAARPKGLGDFDFPTATEDRSIPIVWGTIDIKGPNVLWYGDYKVTRKRKTVGGQKILVAFQYFIGMDLLLCYGPVDRITQLEISDKVYPNDGEITPAFPITPSATGVAVTFSYDRLLGGTAKGGTVTGLMRMYSGDTNQTRNFYLQTQLGTNIPAYVNIAHVVAEQIHVGERTSIGAYVFRVTRFPNNLGLTGNNHIVRGTIDDGDANPMEILFEVLTSDLWGLSIDPTRIDIVSLRDAGDVLAGEQNGMSWITTSVLPAIDVINEITRQTDAIFFEDTTGKFSVRLVRDDYTLAAQPLFDESNISELSEFTRSSWVGTQNHVNIGYSDRAKEFQDTGAMSQDLANVRIQGAEVRGDYQYPGVKHADTAQAIAERELRTLSFPLAKVLFTTNRDGATLIPGDVVRFSWDKLGITEMAVRIIAIDLGDIQNGKVGVTGTQDVFRVAESIFASTEPTGWTRPSDIAGALIASEELVREMPRLLGNLYPDNISNPSLARTWNILQRPISQSATLQAEVYIDDGAGAGFLEGFGDIQMIPIGILDVEYPQNTPDIETSDLLGVENTIDFNDIVNVAAPQIAAGFNLVLIEGATQAEDEILGFEVLLDDGDGTFKFRNVHRGLMDTQARTHPVGAKCWLFGEAPGYSSSTFGDLQAITVKHVTDTTSDVLDVADALANPLTFAQRTLRPHHPANFTVNATRIPVAVDEASDLDFDWEHRLNSDPSVRDAGDGDATGQDTEVEYDIEFRQAVSQVVLRTPAALVSPSPGWLTYLYTTANLLSDTGEVGNFPLEVRLKARYAAGATNNPANLTSLQNITRQFNVDMGGATVQSIDLDGTTEFLADTTDKQLGISDNFTLNVWVRGSSNAGGTERIIFWTLGDFLGADSQQIKLSLTDDSNGSAFNIHIFSSTIAFEKDYDFGSYTVNTWTMITITWDNVELIVLQDGVVQFPTKNEDDSISGMFDADRKTSIGGTRPRGSVSASWAGHIFSPALWATALTTPEIVEIENGGSGFNLRENLGDYVSRSSLAHLWDFRDSTDIGYDYRNLITHGVIDVMDNAANIDGTDLDAGEVP